MKSLIKTFAIIVIVLPLLGYLGYQAGYLFNTITYQINDSGLNFPGSWIYLFMVVFPLLPALFVYFFIRKKKRNKVPEPDDIYMFEPFFEGSPLHKVYVLLSIVLLGSLPILLFANLELYLSDDIHHYLILILIFTLFTISLLYGLVLFKNTRIFYTKYEQFLVPVFSYSTGLILMIFVIKFFDFEMPERINLHGLIIFIFAVFALLTGVKLLLMVNRTIHDKKARAEDELNFASEIQQHFLNDRSEKTDKLSAYGISKAAREVGGDFLCLYQNPETKKVTAAVGDVSGHSFGAGLIMSMLNTMVEEHLRFNHSLKNLLSNLNSKLLNQPRRNIFATFAAIEISNYSLTLWNAGHMPLLIFRSVNNELLKVRQSGLALGMTKMASYTPKEITLQQGDFVLLYSDGLVETRDEEGNIRDEAFLEQTVRQVLASGADCKTAAQKIIQHCLDNDYNPFPEDDATLIALQIK